MNNCYDPMRYRQSSSGKTHYICRRLEEANGDVKLVIERIGKKFSQQSSDLSDASPKAKDRKDILYTHENIEKEHVRYSVSRVHERSTFESAYELYENLVKLVHNYCESNSSINDYQSFCLHFFLGCLYSRLTCITSPLRAAENYAKAFAFAEKLQDLDSTIISESIRKNRAICITDGVDYENLSIEDALLSRTYIDREIYENFSSNSLVGLSDAEIRKNDDLSVHGLNNLPQLFKSIGCTQFSQLVLKLHALDALLHNRFKILFVFKMKTKNAAGIYNSKNTVRVLLGLIEKIRCNLFHELTHKAMNRVFDNWCIPYFKDDQNAKQSYRESMKQVLLNLINFASPSPDTDFNKLAFNELVQFCFGEKLLMDAIKEKNQPYMFDLFKSLRNVFDEGYPVARLDAEFITNALNYLIHVENDSAYVRCVQPLLDYIDKFVIPEMEKYIDGHPCRGLLKR